MFVDLWHAQVFDGVAFEIELDEHGGFVAHYPAFVPGLNLDEFGGFVFHNTAVGESDIDLTLRHETNMGVHTILASHEFA
jgi:hypothetical protein